jgi:ATP-dependent RNA helicase DDX55/SPB4
MDASRFAPWSTLSGVTLSKPVLSFLTEQLHFSGAAPVQASVIPLLMRGRDVVVEAITGSGKTLAFLVPAAELLLTPRVLAACRESRHTVVAAFLFPTRELAAQVHAIARQLIRHINQKLAGSGSSSNAGGGRSDVFAVGCFVGGRDVAKDLAEFQSNGAHLLLGTPGRLNELLVTNRDAAACFDLRTAFELLVLDEADRLLDLGFRPTLHSLLRRFPRQRRTALFSATQSRELADLARAGTRDPLLVTVREHHGIGADAAAGGAGQPDGASPDGASVQHKAQVPARLRNRFLVTRYGDRLDALLSYMQPELGSGIILVYVATCAGVEWLHAALGVLLAADAAATNTTLQPQLAKAAKAASGGGGVVTPPPPPPAASARLFALHGQLSMTQRRKVHRLAAATPTGAVVVCSDVAARGLDLPNVRHVIQFDAPTDPRTFVHRIGRTARMGQDGDSLLLLSPTETDYVAFLGLQGLALEEYRLARHRRRGLTVMGSDSDSDSDHADAGGGTKDASDAGARDDAQDNAVAARAGAPVDRRRTIASAMPERLRLKAARGRTATLAKKRHDVQRARRAVVAVGDLCESPAVLTLRRAAAFGGRADLIALAARAFVSFVRAYKEHECRNIFRLQRIDLTDLANGFALFFVPNCGEMRLMHKLHVPLQAELAAFASEIDASRKRAHAERFAAERVAASSAAAAAAERPVRPANAAAAHAQSHDEGGDDDGADEDEPDSRDDVAPARPVAVSAGTRRQPTVHELARETKARIRGSGLSQAAKRRAWAAADLAELRREAFLVRQERRGRIPTERVDELIGSDALDNAMMSARERRGTRRTRSQRSAE